MTTWRWPQKPWGWVPSPRKRAEREGQTSEEDSSPVGSEVETELVTKTGHCWGVWERGLWRREEGGELLASLLRTPGTVLFLLARAVSGE